MIHLLQVLTTRAGEARDVAAELSCNSCDGIVVAAWQQLSAAGVNLKESLAGETQNDPKNH
jgi:hypothetical protein